MLLRFPAGELTPAAMLSMSRGGLAFGSRRWLGRCVAANAGDVGLGQYGLASAGAEVPRNPTELLQDSIF